MTRPYPSAPTKRTLQAPAAGAAVAKQRPLPSTVSPANKRKVIFLPSQAQTTQRGERRESGQGRAAAPASTNPAPKTPLGKLASAVAPSLGKKVRKRSTPLREKKSSSPGDGTYNECEDMRIGRLIRVWVDQPQRGRALGGDARSSRTPAGQWVHGRDPDIPLIRAALSTRFSIVTVLTVITSNWQEQERTRRCLIFHILPSCETHESLGQETGAGMRGVGRP
jgi:hypothetical protein